MPRFIGIALYLPSDLAASTYFSRFQDEASAFTGSFIVLLPEQVEHADPQSLVQIFEPGSVASQRFPGLRRTDLPCLWIEDEADGHAILPMPAELESTKRYLGALADCEASAGTAIELKRLVDQVLLKDTEKRSPALQFIRRLKNMPGRGEFIAAAICALLFIAAIFAAGLFMPGPGTDKAIAVVCGVIFVSIILVVALFIPSPTQFQERVFRIVLSLASAGFVSTAPGFLEITLNGWIKAGGALAVFVIVFFYNPASLLPGAEKG